MSYPSKEPDNITIFPSDHPGTQFPATESIQYLIEAHNDLFHSRALIWVLLDHVSRQVFQKVESDVALAGER
jgi:hypothetical protein